MVRLSRELSIIKLSPGQLQDMAKFIEGQEDALALYLYGSYGTVWQTGLSDVDLALLPVAGCTWNIHRELELLAGLQDIGKSEDINTINLRSVPVTLQMRVLETGRLLFCREEQQLADFIEGVIRRFCDFQPDLRDIYRDFDAGLREEFL